MQAPLTGVEGHVTDDSTGAALHGARVELTDRSAWTVTDTLGYYSLRAAAGGTRRLRVMRLGYVTQELEVGLASLGALRVDVALRPHPELMPAVLVSVPRFVRETVASMPFRALGVRRWSAAQLRTDPTTAEPDALATLGAEADVSIAPESPTSFHARGGFSDQTRFLVDGMPFYNPTHGAGVFGALNPDALDAAALHTGARSASVAGSLAATVDAETRRPDSTQTRVRGGVSPTAMRLTLDGRLGPRVDLLLSARRGAPSLFGGRPDRTRLTAGFSDWLVKAGSRVGSGTLTLLALAANDRTAFSTRAEAQRDGSPPARHTFDWGASTVAARWTAPLGLQSALNLDVWRAGFDADAMWLDSASAFMASARQTLGLQASLVRYRANGSLRVGAEVVRDRAVYDVRDSGGTSRLTGPLAPAAQSSVVLFGEYDVQVSERLRLRPGLRTMALASGGLLAAPSIAAAFHLTPTLTVSAGLARAHQTVQSLRNEESPATSVFGPDLPILSGAGVPVARSDEATLTLAAQRGPHLRLSLDTYGRRLTGLAVPPLTSAIPFATDTPGVGRGYAIGASAGVEILRGRFAGRLSTGAGSTRIRLRHAADPETAYQPGFYSTRSLTAAAGYRVGDALTVRSAVFARWGRRATLYDGSMDWEGCDAFDGGCEIAGTPGQALGAPSGRNLPTYLRFDVGARRAFVAQVGTRQVQLEAHATIRNVLDRRNISGFSGPAAQVPQRLMLRPLSLLTAGLDFRF